MALDDVDRIAGWFGDFDDVALFDRGLPIPVGPQYVREMWKKSLEYSDPPSALWFIAEDPETVPAAVCGLQSINYIHGDAVVPIFVAAKMRGKGLALAMAIEVIDLAFTTLRLHRLTTFFREDNAATRAITQKLGFSVEGTMRQAWFSNGIHKDSVQVGLLKTEWQDRRERLAAELEQNRVAHLTTRPAD